MFPASTQAKHWMFADEDAVVRMRHASHEAYVRDHFRAGADEAEVKALTVEEADDVIAFYERKLSEFCQKFQPPMYKSVEGMFESFLLFNCEIKLSFLFRLF